MLGATDVTCRNICDLLLINFYQSHYHQLDGFVKLSISLSWVPLLFLYPEIFVTVLYVVFKKNLF